MNCRHLLALAVTAAFLTTAAKAETINCTEITSIPVVITAQGIYCLKSGKSSRQSAGAIIDIRANNVTIDLNGFKLGGLGAAIGASTGIFANDRQNITIRNGIIRGFSLGIVLSGSSSSGHLVEDVLLDKNGAIGIEIGGDGYVVRNNRVISTGAPNEGVGIFVRGRNGVVADNIVSGTSAGMTSADGIAVIGATLVEVRNNTVLDTKDATSKFGIGISSSTDITVIGNRILNSAGTGTQGVFSNASSGVNCIGNTVAGFTTPLAGCNFVSGNITP